jgi:hypothetical protein
MNVKLVFIEQHQTHIHSQFRGGAALSGMGWPMRTLAGGIGDDAGGLR